jgi:hypothetical protein
MDAERVVAKSEKPNPYQRPRAYFGNSALPFTLNLPV